MIQQGRVPQRFKELAYLKGSLGHACADCTRAPCALSKRIGLSEPQLQAPPTYADSDAFDTPTKAILRDADAVTQRLISYRH